MLFKYCRYTPKPLLKCIMRSVLFTDVPINRIQYDRIYIWVHISYVGGITDGNIVKCNGNRICMECGIV